MPTRVRVRRHGVDLDSGGSTRSLSASTIQDGGLLGAPVGEKAVLVQAIDLRAGELDRLEHGPEMVDDPSLFHTGCACDNTSARNFSGRSPGVSRSTRTPSSS